MRGLWKLRQGMLLLVVMAVVAGCSSDGATGSGGASTGTTEMSGTWSASGTGACTSGCTGVTASYQVKLVSSPCSVTTPLGVFSVQGSVCFIANNNSGSGSIAGSGIPTSSKSLGQGVLVGTAADPVPDNSTVNLVFVSAASGGKFTEFTGTATVVGGKMTGSGVCSSASTSSCTGTSATFTATHQ